MNRKIWIPCLLLLGLNSAGCSVFKTRADIAKENEATEIKQSLQEDVHTQAEQIAELQSNHTQLLGRLDEIDHRLRQSQSDNANKADQAMRESNGKTADLEARLKVLEDTQKVLLDEVKALHEEKVQALQGPATSKAKGHKSATWEEIEKLVKDKQYIDAVEPLKLFIHEHPKSKNQTKANFYLGESLYSIGEYSAAILAFSEVQEKTPDTGLGRKSTLRIAESFKKIGKNKDARTFAQLLMEKYPDSAEAKSARKLVK